MPPLLLIDDNPSYCSLLTEEGKKFGFEVTYFHNLEEGFGELERTRRYKALVLDDHCHLEPGPGEQPRENFLNLSLKRLAKLEHEHQRIIPYCVFCENPEEYRPELEDITLVFSKHEPPDAMFIFLKRAIAELHETIVRREFADIYNKVQEHFTEKDEYFLTDVLEYLGKSDRAEIATKLCTLRNLLDALMTTACTLHLQTDPEQFSNGSESRTRRIIRELQKAHLPPELSASANLIYTQCSRYGCHNEKAKSARAPRYQPDKFSYQRLVFAWLELANFLL